MFIGSSSESLGIARTMEELLYHDLRIQLWTSDTFKPGTYPIEALLAEVDRCEYAVFVLAPDDINISRNQEKPAPRDNVIFEAGLFMGQLGRHRTFLLYDKEHETKLPSDLKGLTLISYSQRRYQDNPKAALGPAANQIRSALDNKRKLQELDFIKAYIRFIHPETSLTESYSLILAKRMEDIRREIARLDAKSDWYMLVEVKKRLREFFEYSGRYLDGAEFGKLFVRALRELGEVHEAAWTQVKQVAYLLILAGKHHEGRKEILELLNTLPSKDPSDTPTNELRFYCNRYLGISFQRDDITGNLERANRYFEEAQQCINAICENSVVKQEMQARLLGNYGNLALDKGEFKQALEFYTASHDIFFDLNDREHVGIANLQIAQAIILDNRDLENARSYLNNAETLFIRLGWVEGEGRVYEQHAILNEKLTRLTRDENSKRHYVRLAMENAKRAKELFAQIDNQKRLGAVEALLQRIQWEFSATLTNPDDTVKRG
jgi:tetratricopeptide (TPR) repeat protein